MKEEDKLREINSLSEQTSSGDGSSAESCMLESEYERLEKEGKIKNRVYVCGLGWMLPTVAVYGCGCGCGCGEEGCGCGEEGCGCGCGDDDFCPICYGLKDHCNCGCGCGEEEDEDKESPDNHPNPDGNTDGWNSGGHSGNSNGNDTHNNTSTIGSFVQNLEFYTESQMETMKANGTWVGGNVLGLGYIGPDYTIKPDSLFETDEGWIELAGNKASEILSNLKNICQIAMNSVYGQALNRYHSATGNTLTIDVNSLGIDFLTLENITSLRCDSSTVQDSIIVNLAQTEFIKILNNNANLSKEKKINAISTALALGKITFYRQTGNSYTIKEDIYNFNIEKEPLLTRRNGSTILGKIASEGVAVSLDFYENPGLCLCCGANLVIALGIYRRYIEGNTQFTIKFEGSKIIE